MKIMDPIMIDKIKNLIEIEKRLLNCIGIIPYNIVRRLPSSS